MWYCALFLFTRHAKNIRKYTHVLYHLYKSSSIAVLDDFGCTKKILLVNFIWAFLLKNVIYSVFVQIPWRNLFSPPDGIHHWIWNISPWLFSYETGDRLSKPLRWTLTSRNTIIRKRPVSIEWFHLLTALYFFHRCWWNYACLPQCNCLKLNYKTNH